MGLFAKEVCIPLHSIRKENECFLLHDLLKLALQDQFVERERSAFSYVELGSSHFDRAL